jgi:NAD(P)-dependent dehydrogenase (short-subunit alcohol dehydrogenase family)
MAALRSELQGLGHEHQPNLRGIVCDVTQPDQVAALAAQARELLGTVDVWVCNAGAALLFVDV